MAFIPIVKRTLSRNPVDDDSDSDDFRPPKQNNSDRLIAQTKKPKFEKRFKCSHCDYSTDIKCNLLSHELTHLKTPTKKKVFECSPCSYKTDHSGHWKNHINSSKHKTITDPDVSIGNFACPLPRCSFSGLKMNNLHIHLAQRHNVDLKREDINFENEEEFNAWRNQLMTAENEKYVPVKDEGNWRLYRCHRSGSYVSKENGKREPKKMGSIKCGSICPAQITVHISECGLKVSCIRAHLGHDREPGKVGIASPMKNQIASMMKDGVPVDKISKKMVETYGQEHITRINLLTTMDFINIGNKFGVSNSIQLNRDDAQSVHLKVQQLQRENAHSVFLYKAFGDVSTAYPALQEDEFVLAYMNTGQQHMLSTAGQNIICIDGTHGTNSYGFELTTLLTIDDSFEGFPCVFFFHSRKAESTYEVFYQALKDRVGQMKTKVFMSDNEPAFWNAWVKVMCAHIDRPKKLLCMWHVLRAWHRRISKIKGGVEKFEVFHKLHAIMKETSEPDFELAFLNLLQEVQGHAVFGEIHGYLQTYWESRSEWACCFRLHAGVNTNMSLENMHKEIKHRFLKGKSVKRLDIGIHGVLEFLHSRQHKRVVIQHRGKLTSKDHALRRAHKSSAGGVMTSIISLDQEWIVPSFRDASEQYSIKRNIDNCGCDTRCRQCDTCIHAFTCTCYESSIRSNMCKHIHLICRYLSQNAVTGSEDEVDDDLLMIDTDMFRETRQEEITSHLQDLHAMDPCPHNPGKVEDLMKLALEIAIKHNKVDLLEHKIQEAITAILEDAPMASFPSTPGPSHASNGKIDHQLRSFQKKQKQKPQNVRPARSDIMKALLQPRLLPGEDVPVELLEFDVGAYEEVGVNSE